MLLGNIGKNFGLPGFLLLFNGFNIGLGIGKS